MPHQHHISITVSKTSSLVCKEKLKIYNLGKQKPVCLVHSSVGQLIFLLINLITHNGSSRSLEEKMKIVSPCGWQEGQAVEGGLLLGFKKNMDFKDTVKVKIFHQKLTVMLFFA